MIPVQSWLQQLRDAALEFCQTVLIINGPPDLRPWDRSQILWSGRRAPQSAEGVFTYYPLGPATGQVAILGEESRSWLSRFAEVFATEASYRDAYGELFLRDMLIGLLQLSLPGASIAVVPSPYWKRYVAPAVAQLRAGSPERYAEAVVTALRSLPAPHPLTLVVLPLAGVRLTATTHLAGLDLIPDAACSSDPDLAHCGMFIHRLGELRARTENAGLVFAKMGVAAEPGLAVQRAVGRAEQVCRLLRLLPNPGLADSPLRNPPRVDLDASDSAAFYIAETSVGSHPIPLRRATSEPQGDLNSWRVKPCLSDAPWQRLAALIEHGASCAVEERLLTALRHLGNALAEPAAAAAVSHAVQAVTAMAAPPDGVGPNDLCALAAGLLSADRCEQERARTVSMVRGVLELAGQLQHDLDRAVSAEMRGQSTWLAFSLLEALLRRPGVRGYCDLIALAGIAP